MGGTYACEIRFQIRIRKSLGHSSKSITYSRMGVGGASFNLAKSVLKTGIPFLYIYIYIYIYTTMNIYNTYCRLQDDEEHCIANVPHRFANVL